MARLIDADDLLENAIDYVDWYSAHLHGFTVGSDSEDNAFMRYNDVIAAIKNVPTIDAVPVVHGEWIDMQEDDSTEGMWRCSVCWSDRYFDIMTPTECGCFYCPNCGAKMDGGNDR